MSSPIDGDIYVPTRGTRDGSEKAVRDMNAPSLILDWLVERPRRGPVEQCHFCDRVL